MSDVLSSVMSDLMEKPKKKGKKPEIAVDTASALDYTPEKKKVEEPPPEPPKLVRTIPREKPLWVQKEERYMGVEWEFDETKKKWRPKDAV